MAIVKVPKFWSAMHLGRPSAAADIGGPGSASLEGLDAFGSEEAQVERTDTTANRRAGVRWNGSTLTVAKWVGVITLTAALAIAAVLGYQRRLTPPAAPGIVTIETTPAGLDVHIGGKSLGKTPLTTSLAAGTYNVQVGVAPNIKNLNVTVSAGGSVMQHVEFAPESRRAAGSTGGLRVITEPASLPVLVDGAARGVSPVLIDDLQPGEHEVSVRTSAGLIRRKISIQASETLSLLLSSAAPAPDPSAISAGWMSVSSAIPLQLREGGKLIGTSESDRLMLTAGDHDVEFSNAELGFTLRRTLRVAAGKTAAMKIELPNGVISVNAQPWAEVWINGERIGETPIGNLSRPIGTYEVVFRHPELGERRQSVVVAVGKPARIGVDLRKK